jgi:hypothetical protein
MMRAAGCLLLLGAAFARAQEPTGYTFTLDGAPCTPTVTTIEGSAGEPRAGDVVSVIGFRMVLDAPGHYAFTTEGEPLVRRMWCERDGLRTLALVDLRAAAEVEDLTAADWLSLRGLRFQAWNEDLARCLDRIDGARCVVQFDRSARPERLPTFPRQLRYLALPRLEAAGLHGLADLHDLVYLTLPWQQEITTVDWIAGLPLLRHLELEATGVTDLAPLGGHGRLRTVLAPSTPITQLPTVRLPQLERMVAYASGCPAEEAARFRALQPGAQIAMTFRDLLVARLQPAAGLRIRTGSTCHPKPNETVVYASDRPDEVAALVGLLRTREAYSRPYSVPGCEPRVLQFLDAHGELLLEVGLFESMALRCYDLWNKPVSLDPDHREPLRRWLTERGVHL